MRRGFFDALRQPKWRLVALLACAAALNYADRAAFSAVLPPLRAELGISDVELGLLGSCFLWAYALASPAAGALADRFSRRTLILGSLCGWSVITLFTGCASGFVTLVVLRISLGVAESFYLPAAVATLADRHDRTTRARAIGLHSASLNFGVVIGGAFAGYLAEACGWRWGFWILGAAGIVLASFAYSRLHPTLAVQGPAPAKASVAETFRYLVRVGSFHLILVKGMLAGVTVWIFLNWLPLYFREIFNLSLGAAGFVGMFMLQISTVIGLIVGAVISDRVAANDVGRRVLLLAGCYFAAAPLLLLFLADPGFPVVVLAVSLFSFLRGMGEANEKPALCEFLPERFRATALGLMNTCATAAGGLGVFMAGWLKGHFGLGPVFGGCAGMLFLAGAVILIAYRFFVPRDLRRARAFTAATTGALVTDPV